MFKNKKVQWDWDASEAEDASRELKKKIKQAAEMLNVSAIWLADKLREERKNVQTH
jgi:hypothetical protein